MYLRTTGGHEDVTRSFSSLVNCESCSTHTWLSSKLNVGCVQEYFPPKRRLVPGHLRFVLKPCYVAAEKLLGTPNK